MSEAKEAVGTWQRCPYVHPLTCGNKSSHRLLRAQDRDGEVILVCPDCDYEQELYPSLKDMVLGMHRRIEERGSHPHDDEPILALEWRTGDENG